MRNNKKTKRELELEDRVIMLEFLICNGKHEYIETEYDSYVCNNVYKKIKLQCKNCGKIIIKTERC